MPDGARNLRVIPEHPGAGRLGRHVVHDPRSRDYPVTRLLAESGDVTVPVAA